MDIVLVVDESASIVFQSSDNWDRVLDFLQEIVRQFRIEPDYSQVGLVTFRYINHQ